MVLVLAMAAIGGFVVAPQVLFAAAAAPAPRRSGALPWFAVAIELAPAGRAGAQLAAGCDGRCAPRR